MPSPDERQILEIIGDRGGQTNIATIAAKMGIRYEYCSIICNSIGSKGYVDVFIGGKIRLTPKGWAAIGKSPTDQLKEKTEGLASTRETILRQLGAKGPSPQAEKTPEDYNLPTARQGKICSPTQGKPDEETIICPLCGSKVPKAIFFKESSKAAPPFRGKGGAKSPLDWFKDMTHEKPADLPSVQETIMEQLENEGPEPEPSQEKPKKQ